ncbi:YkgJ family cysteine cluster protein [Paenibacillus filicis]|uniref:YkgJ family cysteine cluster protein n=1 Tax=Paenibacillus gyeongsangnamensis TaxID=3388067 RepID=A0ABT4QII4_9BACL|nr:YkgJ family cysteine cluster protein [Paenibacillus filicis]MCZ8516592.1 YkgJ family cysteine cluster protein [Paenibacillus filicis]
MESLPCQGCKGMCCGPVPVSEQELKNIKKKIKMMSPKNRLELENQIRYYGTCIFYDQVNDKCGIHSARPSICRAFVLYKNLVCFRKPEAAAAANWNMKEVYAGILSKDFTWKDF